VPTAAPDDRAPGRYLNEVVGAPDRGHRLVIRAVRDQLRKRVDGGGRRDIAHRGGGGRDGPGASDGSGEQRRSDAAHDQPDGEGQSGRGQDQPGDQYCAGRSQGCAHRGYHATYQQILRAVDVRHESSQQITATQRAKATWSEGNERREDA